MDAFIPACCALVTEVACLLTNPQFVRL